VLEMVVLSLLAWRSGARLRPLRALPPSPEPEDRAPRPGRGAAAAFHSVSRLEPTRQVEPFESAEASLPATALARSRRSGPACV